MGRQDSEPFSRRGLTNHGRIREYARKLIADYAARSGQKPEDLRKAIGEDGVKRFAEMASLKKTVDFLKANAE